MIWPFRRSQPAPAIAAPQTIAWAISDAPIPYPKAAAAMERRAADIAAGKASELVWLLEHPPLYTAGTSARRGDLLDARRFPVYQTGRGGQYTYHGPGQRVAYVMLDLRRHAPSGAAADVRVFVHKLEQWIIDTLAQFNLKGERRQGRVGIWIPRAPGSSAEDKIAAIGIRVKRGISFHGIAINVEPDLSHFAGIVPCGIKEHGVTSLVQLGYPVSMADVDVALRSSFEALFGPTQRSADPLGGGRT